MGAKRPVPSLRNPKMEFPLTGFPMLLSRYTKLCCADALPIKNAQQLRTQSRNMGRVKDRPSPRWLTRGAGFRKSMRSTPFFFDIIFSSIGRNHQSDRTDRIFQVHKEGAWRAFD